MTTESEKSLEALDIAIQMEIDGKEFYTRASRMSGNELGRKLLLSLAAEEDLHRRKFEEIYEAISRGEAWLEVGLPRGQGEARVTMFARAAEKLGSGIEVPANELEAIRTAMTMENESYDFYRSRMEKAGRDAERSFYEAVAAEEKEHYLVLLDYYEYIQDPAGWFVQKERPSLDGA